MAYSAKRTISLHSETFNASLSFLGKVSAEMDARLLFLFARRSIRLYTSEPVGEAAVHALLEAGMAAPSARNAGPWHSVVVRKRERLRQLGGDA